MAVDYTTCDVNRYMGLVRRTAGACAGLTRLAERWRALIGAGPSVMVANLMWAAEVLASTRVPLPPGFLLAPELDLPECLATARPSVKMVYRIVRDLRAAGPERVLAAWDVNAERKRRLGDPFAGRSTVDHALTSLRLLGVLEKRETIGWTVAK